VEEQPTSEPDRGSERSDPGARVLYIEDSEVSVELVRVILSQRPVELIAAGDGAEGIERARSRDPDLILLDLGLPDRPGIEVLEELHADPATESIPVVVLTADTAEEQEARLLAAGAIAYLTKPMDNDLFLALVDGILSRRLEGG
jgi:CheY-like chemotaxis protein